MRNRAQQLIPLATVVLSATVGLMLAYSRTPSEATSGASDQTIVTAGPATSVAPAPGTSIPADDGVVQVRVIGDSYTAGSDMDSGEFYEWPRTLVRMMREDGQDIKLRPDAIGGTGYVAGAEDRQSFVDRVERLGGTPDLVIVFGSRNDAGLVTEASMAEIAEKTYKRISERVPGAKLLVIGPAWTSSDVPTGVLDIRDGLRQAANAVGATFFDPISEGWFADGGMIGSDGIHPTDDGHIFMAEQIRQLIEELVYPGQA